MTERENTFAMRVLLPALLFLGLAETTEARATTVAIVDTVAAPQSQYASRKLGAALRERGYALSEASAGGDFTITLAVQPETLSAESFSITPAGKTIAIAGGDTRGLIYGALALREQLLNGTRLEQVRGVPREARASVPRHQVQHALGHLPAELRARPALRHGARPQILGSLPRHDGREPLQRVHAVDHASVHLHDPAHEFSRGQQVDSPRNSPSGSTCIAKSSAWRRSAGSTPTWCSGASS